MRARLSEYASVDPGIQSEWWGFINETSNRRNYLCGNKLIFHGTHRVASAPWFFFRPNPAVIARVLPALFVLILRDPVERFISSFFHLHKDEHRAQDLPKLMQWATKGSITISPAVRYVLSANYYVLDVERMLQQAIVAVPRDLLLVGLVEEHAELLGRVVHRMGIDPTSTRGVPQRKGTIFKSSSERVSSNRAIANVTNASPRNASRWTGFPIVIDAARRYARARTNFSSIATRLAGTSSFPHRIGRVQLECLWRTTSGRQLACG